MTQANDSILVTPGVGATVATNNPGDGKEYQVIMMAGRGGHLLGTRPTYIAQTPASVLAANKHHLTIFNGSGSGKLLTIQAIIARKNMAAVTGVPFELDFNWITASGSGGTAITAKPLRQTNPAIPAQIGFWNNRTSPTEDTAAFQWIQWLHSEETNIAAQVQEAFPIWPPGTVPVLAEWQDLTLEEGDGLTLKQITSTTAGTYYFTVMFCLE